MIIRLFGLLLIDRRGKEEIEIKAVRKHDILKVQNVSYGREESKRLIRAAQKASEFAQANWRMNVAGGFPLPPLVQTKGFLGLFKRTRFKETA